MQKSIAKERRAIKLFKTSTAKSTLREQLIKAHKQSGHVTPSRLMKFKSKGRIYSSLIPSAGRLEFKSKNCPICLAMKGRKPAKPTSLPTEERSKLGLWEKVGVDPHFKETDIIQCLCARRVVESYTSRTRRSLICPLYFSNSSHMLAAFLRW